MMATGPAVERCLQSALKGDHIYRIPMADDETEKAGGIMCVISGVNSPECMVEAERSCMDLEP